MKFAICNETYEGWAFEDQVRNVAEIGYQGLELAPFTIAENVNNISPRRRRELRTFAADHGVELTGLHWLLVSPKGLYLTDPDPAIRRKTIRYLQAQVRFCGDIGGRQVVLGSHNQRNVIDGVEYEDAWKYAGEGIHAASEVGEEYGVFFLVEPLPEPDCNFILNLAEARSMVDFVGHPNCRMMVDVKSMCAEKKPIEELIVGTSDLLEYVHANDANLRGPGFGETDFVPIFTALNSIGYQGFISVEVFNYNPDPVTIAKESLRYMKKCMGEAGRARNL